MKYFAKVKRIRDEYEMLTGVKPPYSTRAKDVAELISEINDIKVGVEFRRLAEIEDYSDADFYQKPYPIGNYLKQFQLDTRGRNDLLTFLNYIRPKIIDTLQQELNEIGSFKFAITVKTILEKQKVTGSEYTIVYSRTQQHLLLDGNNIIPSLEEMFPILQEHLERFVNLGSGWTLDEIQTVWLDIANYEPLAGNSYLLLPKALRDKKCIINPINKKDNLCFFWCILASESSVPRDPQRISWYKDKIDDFFYEYKEDGRIVKKLPKGEMSIDRIPKFEKSTNRAINVFGWDDQKKNVIIYYISKQPTTLKRINLMLIERNGNRHYTWIKNFNRMLFDQTKYEGRKYFCETCLYGYSKESLLNAPKPIVKEL